MNELTKENCQRYQQMTIPRLSRRLCSAAQRNELETIKYILTSSELSKHPTIDYKEYKAVKYAGYAEQINVLNYFFHHHLNEQEKITLSEHLFINGCQTSRMETLNWAIEHLFSNNINTTLNRQEQLYKKGLYSSIYYGKLNVIKKLLFEFNFSITKEELTNNDIYKGALSKTIEDLVDKKILHHNLQQNCSQSNNTVIKKAKI